MRFLLLIAFTVLGCGPHYVGRPSPTQIYVNNSPVTVLPQPETTEPTETTEPNQNDTDTNVDIDIDPDLVIVDHDDILHGRDLERDHDLDHMEHCQSKPKKNHGCFKRRDHDQGHKDDK